MRDIMLKCPINGQRHKITEPEGEPSVLDADEAADLPLRWGELVLRQVLPNPAFAAVSAARAARAQELTTQIAAAGEQMGASEADLEAAQASIPGQIEREMPLPVETVTVEWAFNAISPDGMTSLAEELGKLGLVLQPLEDEDEAPADA